MSKLKNNKEFGKTGLMVPKIIYGTSYLGNLFFELSEDIKFEIVKQWFSCTEKPVVIDTAGKYGAGLALEMLGKLLNRADIDPDHVLISNKLGWYRVPLTTPEPGFEPGVWAGLKYDAVQRISYKGILECWEQGNELMGGKYKVNLLSVHDPDEYLNSAKNLPERNQKLQDIRDAYKALFELRDKGIIKGVGIGSKDWLVIKELSEYLDFDWVMLANKFTIFHHPPEIVDFIEKLNKKGVGIINSAVFNAGFLTGGEYFDYKKIDESDPGFQPVFKWRTKFLMICKDYKVKPSDACIQFGLSHPAISGVSLNTSNPAKMPENVKSVNTSLPIEFWKALKNEKLIDPDYKYL